MLRSLKLFTALLLALTLLAGCSFIGDFERFLGDGSSGSSDSSEEETQSSEPEEESSEPEVPEWPVTVGGVTVEGPPESVVVLSPSLYEILRGMGFDGPVKGVGSFCGNDELPQCGTAMDPDVDAIAALSPQYLLTSSAPPEKELELLEQAGIAVITLEPAVRLEGLEKLYTDLALFSAGLVLGEEAAESYWDGCMKLLEAATEKAGQLADAEDILYLRMPELTVATADTLEGELMTRLGFTNAAGKYGGWVYPKEDVGELSPDVIIADADVSEGELEKSELYSGSPAVKNGLVCRTDMSVFERQGREMFEELLRVMNELAQNAG